PRSAALRCGVVLVVVGLHLPDDRARRPARLREALRKGLVTGQNVRREVLPYVVRALGAEIGGGGAIGVVRVAVAQAPAGLAPGGERDDVRDQRGDLARQEAPGVRVGAHAALIEVGGRPDPPGRE